MFCPTCGKDNSAELKYCASCGTDLQAVSLALTGREEDFFTKLDTSVDQLIARHSEHVFRNAPRIANKRRVAHSWQILGMSAITTLVDLLMFILMVNLLPIRMLLLIVSTPFRLLSERAKNDELRPEPLPAYQAPDALPPAGRGDWRSEPAPSVTENTTTLLDAPRSGSVITGRFD